MKKAARASLFALGRMRAKEWLGRNDGREWRGKESRLYRAATERQHAVVKREIRLARILIFLGSCHVQRRGGPTLERFHDSSFETATRRDAAAATATASAYMLVFSPIYFSTVSHH